MKILDFEQNSDEWYAARRGIPTASEFSNIITPKTGVLSKSADPYIAELLAELVCPDEATFAGNQWTERGKALEDEARNWYEFQYEVAVEQVGIILRDDEMAAASPDGLIGIHSGLEIKCPAPKTHVAWLMAGQLPDEHRPQIHGNILLSEREQWEFVSYCPGFEPLVVTVCRDDYTEKLSNALDTFIDRLLTCRERFIK